MIAAPAPSAARITSGLLVSTDSGTPSRASDSTSGTTRCSSSSSVTSAAPGRVDSPPMSRMSAPSSTRRSACASAVPYVECWPPSENESGVTLTMPMISGRASESTRPRTFHAVAM